ncbi:hypothetical protein Tco_1302879 [Tanacetum coccineum]
MQDLNFYTRRSWTRKFSWKFGNIFEKVIEWKEKLQIIQRKVDQDPHNSILKKHEADILKEYCAARKDEEKLLLQKAKIDWLSDGDKNSKFFHSVMKGRAHRSRIETVNDENGVSKYVSVAEECALNLCVSQMRRLRLCGKFDVEIKKDLFDICDNKAPGPDGYSAKSSNVHGRQITDNILLTQELLRGYNWKNGARRAALKIDIQKAYDTVN